MTGAEIGLLAGALTLSTVLAQGLVKIAELKFGGKASLPEPEQGDLCNFSGGDGARLRRMAEAHEGPLRRDGTPLWKNDPAVEDALREIPNLLREQIALLKRIEEGGASS